VENQDNAEQTREKRAELLQAIQSQDPVEAKEAFQQLDLGGLPLKAWAQDLLMGLASRAGHPLRYEAMLLLNGGA
jgi:hypothetical protein